MIRLDSGDPDLPTPEPIRQALITAIESGATRYADPLGIEELRALIASDLSARAADSYQLDQIVVTHGATEALLTAALATLDRGDRVVIPAPSYSIFPDVVRIAGAQPILVPATSDLRLDIDQLAAVARGARMIILCHPNSPTGRVYSRSELAALVSIVTENDDLLVLADEVYDQIVFDGTRFRSLLTFPELRDRVLYAQSFSKTYAMTGWRIGYLAAPAWAAAACGRIHRTVTGSLNTAVQHAAAVALQMDGSWVEDARREYQKRRDIVTMHLGPSQTPWPPDATFFAWCPHPRSISSLQFAALAAEHGVRVRPGTEFGPSGEGHFALSFSIGGPALEQGLSRLRAALDAAERMSPARALHRGEQ